MSYTFVPKQRFAKASGSNLRISAKSAGLLCAAIRKKPLRRAKRLLQDLAAERRSLGGNHYTKTAKKMLELLESCEKNAEFLGLDAGRLLVHASAHLGAGMRRRRRKAAFGSGMKSANLEIFLIERGRLVDRVPKEKMAKKAEETEVDEVSAK